MPDEEKHNEPEALQCTSCGAALHIDSNDQEFVTCEYCGTTFSVSDLLDESDEVKKARIWANAYKHAEADKEGDAPLPPSTARRKKARTIATTRTGGNARRMGTGTTVKVVLLVCGILTYGIFALASFDMGSALGGMVGLAQAALLCFATYLVVAKKTPPNATLLCIVSVVLSFALVVPWSCALNEDSSYSYSHDFEEFSWDSLALSNQLPACSKNSGYIYSNSSSRLSIEIGDVSEVEYNEYVTACREAGYTVEQDIQDGSFSAFNEEGYELSLDYYEYSSEMDIRLVAPLPMTTMIWPSGTLADTVPQPDSTTGYVEYANSSSVTIYIDGMTKEAVQDYQQECIDGGYSNIESMYEGYLRATNAAGDELTVQYEGNEVMSISIYDEA